MLARLRCVEVGRWARTFAQTVQPSSKAKVDYVWRLLYAYRNNRKLYGKLTQVAKTNPGILMDALEKTSVEDILLTKPVWWNLRNELALRLLPVINERNEWAQKADDVSSVIKGATVASSLSLTFPLCELYTNYLEKRLEKIEDKDRITLLQAFANQAKGKVEIPVHIVRELTKITAARFEHLNFDAVGDLLGSEQHLRYYSDELMSKIANRLTNASLREMFIMPEQVTSSPIPTMLNRNVCINLSMLCHMNMYDTAERILDRLQENDIEINETFCCAVLFVICKMKGERYHKLVSRCINQLNAFKRTSLQKGLNNRYRGMLSVSNYIMDKLGLYKDLRLKEQVSGDPFEEDSDSQSYLENTVKALIDSAMHDESVRRYRDDVFEHDLYYPKLNTIVEFLGPNHFFINRPFMVMNKNLLKIRERCLGPSMKIIYVHHAIMPRTHIANSTSMPNVLERYVQEGGFKIE